MNIKIRRIGNLFQLYTDSLHTVFQSHNYQDVCDYAREHCIFITEQLKCNGNIGRVEYGRLKR